jgi:pimeloyl-ACP methyl ester carboxylesterase
MQLTTHHLGGDGRPLLFVHGNGMHAHVLEPLASFFPGRECIGIDLRGFGHSECETAESIHWSVHGEDLRATITALDIADADIFAHSMGGGVSMIAELQQSGTLARMVTYEPVAPPPHWASQMDVEGTLRRQRHFDSHESAIERFGSKSPWSEVSPNALRAYVEWGLKPSADGGYELRCDPHHEAMNYRAGLTHDTWDRLHEIAVPTLVMCGGESYAAQRSADIAERLGDGRLHVFEALNHFGPMQNPAEVAAVANNFLD